jgi:hypothetical protein
MNTSPLPVPAPNPNQLAREAPRRLDAGPTAQAGSAGSGQTTTDGS